MEYYYSPTTFEIYRVEAGETWRCAIWNPFVNDYHWYLKPTIIKRIGNNDSEPQRKTLEEILELEMRPELRSWLIRNEL